MLDHYGSKYVTITSCRKFFHFVDYGYNLSLILLPGALRLCPDTGTDQEVSNTRAGGTTA
jgi:hypothetical protein